MHPSKSRNWPAAPKSLCAPLTTNLVSKRVKHYATTAPIRWFILEQVTHELALHPELKPTNTKYLARSPVRQVNHTFHTASRWTEKKIPRLSGRQRLTWVPGKGPVEVKVADVKSLAWLIGLYKYGCKNHISNTPKALHNNPMATASIMAKQLTV